MAINPGSLYPGKTRAPDSDYPFGSARNVTTPGDGTGTPWEAALVNDLFGFQQALLDGADIVPSGTPENVNASQYLAALRVLFTPAGVTTVDVTGNSNVGLTEDQAGRRVLVFEGEPTADIAVIVPDRERDWIVYSNTTGNFTVTLRTDAGTGFDLEQDEYYGARSDGVNVVKYIGTAARRDIGTGADQVPTNSMVANGLNIKAFGATGDGVTDDTDAIKAAIDAIRTAGGGRLYMPRGVYMVSETIQYPSNLYLYGEGKGVSILRAVAGTVFPAQTVTTIAGWDAFRNIRTLLTSDTVESERATVTTNVVLEGFTVDWNNAPYTDGADNKSTCPLLIATTDYAYLKNVDVVNAVPEEYPAGDTADYPLDTRGEALNFAYSRDCLAEGVELPTSGYRSLVSSMESKRITFRKGRVVSNNERHGVEPYGTPGSALGEAAELTVLDSYIESSGPRQNDVFSAHRVGRLIVDNCTLRITGRASDNPMIQVIKVFDRSGYALIQNCEILFDEGVAFNRVPSVFRAGSSGQNDFENFQVDTYIARGNRVRVELGPLAPPGGLVLADPMVGNSNEPSGGLAEIAKTMIVEDNVFDITYNRDGSYARFVSGNFENFTFKDNTFNLTASGGTAREAQCIQWRQLFFQSIPVGVTPPTRVMSSNFSGNTANGDYESLIFVDEDNDPEGEGTMNVLVMGNISTEGSINFAVNGTGGVAGNNVHVLNNIGPGGGL